MFGHRKDKREALLKRIKNTKGGSLMRQAFTLVAALHYYPRRQTQRLVATTCSK